jgi:FKBP-type peptidyl-prolyl cis-trans isomerase
MKKIALLFAAICIFVASAEENNRDAAPVSVMANTLDSMSYAIGVSIGSQILSDFENIPGGYSVDAFLAGLNSVFRNEPLLMTLDFAQDFFQNYMMEAYERETEAKKAEGLAFLAENRTKKGVHETASGLQYIIERNGRRNAPKPNATDVVRVHYHGMLLDGTVFDSSVERGEPIEIPLNQVIQGWTEGVQLMPVGSKFKFFIPYQLAYGERGAGQFIPPFATLIFEVELLEIVQ